MEMQKYSTNRNIQAQVHQLISNYAKIVSKFKLKFLPSKFKGEGLPLVQQRAKKGSSAGDEFQEKKCVGIHRNFVPEQYFASHEEHAQTLPAGTIPAQGGSTIQVAQTK